MKESQLDKLMDVIQGFVDDPELEPEERDAWAQLLIELETAIQEEKDDLHS